MPKEKRDEIGQSDEIFGFMEQSHISDRNVARLRTLTVSPNPQVAQLAALVLEVALVKPYKKRRLKVLAQTRKDLIEKLRQAGLIADWDFDDEMYFD